MRNIPLWLRVLAVIVILPVVGVVAYIGYNLWDERNLPIYEISSTQPPVGGHAVNTLQYGDSSYVSGEFELWLKPTPNRSLWPAFRQRIGKTLDGGTYVRDSMIIYKLNGQNGDDWLVLEGLMTGEWVFRNTRLVPITLNTLEVTSLELIPNQGSTRNTLRTEDQGIISEVMLNLTNSQEEKPASYLPNFGRLYLLSPQLPGLAYPVYVRVDDQGLIYLEKPGQSARQDMKKLIPAGEGFSQWVRAAG